MAYKKRILIDLDVVLNNYTKYEEGKIPEIREGAKEFIEKLYATDKYELVLFTTRDKKLSENWLKRNGINGYFSYVTSQKLPAHLLLDDRAIKFEGDYENAINKILNFQAYWQIA